MIALSVEPVGSEYKWQRMSGMLCIAGRSVKDRLSPCVRSQQGSAKILFLPWTHGSDRKPSARNTSRNNKVQSLGHAQSETNVTRNVTRLRDRQRLLRKVV